MSLLAIVGLPRAATALTDETRVRFGHVGLAEGLSSNWVLALLREHRGFLWVGTQDGLFRFDGSKCAAYYHVPTDPHSLPSSVAGVLYEDSRGRLWVGSRWASQGMALYDRALDNFIRLPVASPPEAERVLAGPLPGLSDGRVNAITEAPDGRLWVATAKGVDLVDYDKHTYVHHVLDPTIRGKPPRLATALLADRQGALWVGTTEGLYHLDQDRKRCVPWHGFAGAGATGLDEQRIEALAQDELGHIWIATVTAGLFTIDPGQRTLRQYLPRAGDDTSLSHVRVRSLALDGAGTLWVGTENGGLDALDRRTGRFRRFLPDPFGAGTLGSASIYALLADRQGILWVGTYDDGLNYYSPSEQRFGLVTASPAGLRDRRVTTFLEARDGALWIGTDGGGLCRLAAGAKAITCLGGPGDDLARIAADSVLTMVQTGDGAIWMGGWGAGLSRLDPSQGTVVRFRHRPDDPNSLVSDDVWRIQQLRSGEIAVATQQGTDLFDPVSGRARRLSQRYPAVSDGMTLVITEASNGDLWLGQNARVQRIDAQTGEATVYGHDRAGPLHLPGGQVFDILEDSRRNIWVGGEGGLVYLAADHPPGSALVTKAGLPHRVVTSLVEDASGNLWITTHGGLSKFAGAAGNPEAPAVAHFDVSDGLQDNEFSPGAALRARDGRLLFGGRRGFNAFFPDQVPMNTTPPPVALTDIRILGRAVRPGQPHSPLRQSITETASLSLSQDLFALTFEFTALNLVQPHKNRYAYMLEGLDGAWSEAGARTDATYTQLRHGDYVFRVRAANNDGVWNQAGLALKLRVEPRWHERAWVRGTLAMLAALIVAGGLGWRARQFRARERELTLRVDERTHALQELNEQLEQRVRDRTVELNSEKQRLSVTLDSIADAVVAADVDGRVGLMNRVAEHLTGLPADTAVGQPITTVVPRLHPHTRRPRPAPTGPLPADDKGLRASESLLVRPDGTELLIAESAAPIRDHEGRTLGVVLAFRDISQQRKLEIQLATSEKLESLGMLAGGIAHDFNNLLAGVFGYLDLVRLQPPGSSKQLETMGKAMALIDKGRGLTNQLLTFSKGEAPTLAPVDLAEVLAKSAEFALSGSNVVHTMHLDRDLRFCRGDRQQIEQVFDNLIINARQAMSDGGAVSIRADNLDLEENASVPLAKGRYVRVSVADQGPGIPREMQGRIFEPFFTTKTKGTGLGLATTHSIVRKHHGYIEVSSEPGRGATFSVYLPAVDAEAGASSCKPAETPGPARRVLLLDDEPEVREVLERMLSELGHTTQAVADGRAAVEAFARARAAGQPFDLALLDLTIPGGPGGREVLARLRALDPGLQAIAVTGYSADPAMTDPTGHGFAGRLGKPCTVNDLALAIGRVSTMRS
ncbi:MAG TPA: two-component regulator propeller domain-containing protein [Polyangia bacterium]|nr:two-component regulator propeller domain-containing protein [Polyangia bacterium]